MRSFDLITHSLIYFIHSVFQLVKLEVFPNTLVQCKIKEIFLISKKYISDKNKFLKNCYFPCVWFCVFDVYEKNTYSFNNFRIDQFVDFKIVSILYLLKYQALNLNGNKGNRLIIKQKYDIQTVLKGTHTTALYNELHIINDTLHQIPVLYKHVMNK